MRIKPCPFCGADTFWASRPKDVENQTSDGDLFVTRGHTTVTYQVQCRACGAAGREVKGKRSEYTMSEETMYAAIAAWNDRSVQGRLDI